MQKTWDDNEIIFMKIGGINAWRTVKHKRDMLKYEQLKGYLDDQYNLWFGNTDKNK